MALKHALVFEFSKNSKGGKSIDEIINSFLKKVIPEFCEKGIREYMEKHKGYKFNSETKKWEVEEKNLLDLNYFEDILPYKDISYNTKNITFSRDILCTDMLEVCRELYPEKIVVKDDLTNRFTQVDNPNADLYDKWDALDLYNRDYFFRFNVVRIFDDDYYFFEIMDY